MASPDFTGSVQVLQSFNSVKSIRTQGSVKKYSKEYKSDHLSEKQVMMVQTITFAQKQNHNNNNKETTLND